MKVSRILVFELNWLGDILFSLPLLRALDRSFPDASLTCAVVPYYAEILRGNPWVDSVVELPSGKKPGVFFDTLSFVRAIRKERYDVCIFLKPSRTRALMAAAAGIKNRIGHPGKGASVTSYAPLPLGRAHRSDIISSLAVPLGIDVSDRTYEYFTDPESEKRAGDILKEKGTGRGKLVALNPGGNWGPKRWPKERFRDLALELLDAFGGIEIAITGSSKDVDLAGEIVSGVGSERCYSLAGSTGIKELAAIFKRCSLVVSADSGPLHLASASGADTIGIFGPTSPELTGQRGRGINIMMHKPPDCRIPCYEKECPKSYECMTAVTTQEVFLKAAEVLSLKT